MGVVLLGLVGLARPGGAAEVRAAVGLERDDNPFEETADGRGGWISRLYASASGYPLNRPRWRAKAQYQGGIKHFWLAEQGVSQGDVVTSDLEVSAQARAARLALSGRGDLKVKGVNRVSSEEGYLRGALEGAVTGLFGKGISGGAHYLRGGVDSTANPDDWRR